MPYRGRKRKESKEYWLPNKYKIGLNVIMYIHIPSPSFKMINLALPQVHGGTDDGYPTEILDHGKEHDN